MGALLSGFGGKKDPWNLTSSGPTMKRRTSENKRKKDKRGPLAHVFAAKRYQQLSNAVASFNGERREREKGGSGNEEELDDSQLIPANLHNL